MSLFFKSPIDIEILFDNEETKKHVEVPIRQGPNSKTLKDSIPLYEDGESISGVVTLRVKEGKKVDHLGIKISVIGSIDMVKTSGGNNNSSSKTSKLSTINNSSDYNNAKKKPVDQFLCLSDDLCPAGELHHSQTYPFMFKDLTKRYESYRGKNVDVSYYIKVTVMRKSTDISKIKKFWVYLFKDIPKITPASSTVAAPTENMSDVEGAATEAAVNGSNTDDTIPNNNQNAGTEETTNNSKIVDSSKNTVDVSTPQNKTVKLDIGIENCLHIEFEFSKAQYSLKEFIVGRIYFLLTRLKIKHMELSIITRETSGLKPSNFLLDSTAIRFEIMDGSPVKGETIPIRLFLSGYDLTPDMSCNYFNVKNYLSLVIIDEEGRRYFKQSPITLYRTR